MNHLGLFSVVSAFIATLLLMYVLTEINNTKSTYGIRKKLSEEFVSGLEFTLWFYKREGILRELYEAELCEDMFLSFEEFCNGVFEGKLITYN